MANIRMILEYDGGRYRGWQRLKHADNTIQGKLEAVISQMVGAPTEVIGSGRTDAGVHALNQVANFHTTTTMTPGEIHRYLNEYLPQDIVVKEVSLAGERFHSRLNATGKKYIYRIWNHWVPSAFDRKYSYHFPTPLDLKKMEAGVARLIGTHDFLAFSAVKKSKKSTVRTLQSITFEQKGPMLEITYIGNGFLHHMVRILTGTLLEIGMGRMEPQAIDEIFQGGRREAAGFTVPAHGLFLAEVYYD